MPRLGRDTIRVLLSSDNLTPCGKNVVYAPLDAGYIRKMEDVLAVYEKPYKCAEPVIFLERSRSR